MARSRNRLTTEVNAGSMADIAFLLLIFFLVTTQIATNKGLTMVLPPPQEVDPPIVPRHERNLFKIQINSADKLLVENEPLDDIRKIRGMVYDFVLNFGDPAAEKKGTHNISDQEVLASLPVSMKNYIQQNLRSNESSDGPSEAIVSLKADRGSSYQVYIQALDEINAAYYKMYGARVGLTDEEFRKLNRNNPRERALFEKGRIGIRKAISLAEPTDVGG